MNHRQTIIKLTTLLLLVLVLSGCISKSSIARVDKFKYPDIKNEFCGVHINFQYCKCAFHNEYCNAIGLSKSAANKEVSRQYDEWVSGQLDDWGEACVLAGAIFSAEKAECTYCKEGFTPDNGVCVEASELADQESEETGEETAAIDRTLFRDDCKLKLDVFERDWKKYSDIDARLGYDERSWEAKQVLTFEEQRIALMVEGFSLEREQEVNRQTRAVLDEYKQALVQNIKTNLLKAFWRLTWITYSTIDSGQGMGKSYAGLFEGIENIGAVAKGVQVIQGLVPGDSALAIDTGSISGKVKSTGVNTALEAVASLGDPVSTATEFVKSSVSVNYPSADITAEEMVILKDQHIRNGAIDAAIKASDARLAAREARMAAIETEIAGLQGKITEWESKEKDRTKAALEDSCQKTIE